MAGDFESGCIRTFVSGIETSARRLKSNMEHIFEKYDKPFPDNDLINVSTLSICKDKGHLKKLRGPHLYGMSKLQSTKKKDEMLSSQIKLSNYSIDPNVSRAIARRCVSYINESATGEDEPSDAETISSDSSDGEDEEDGDEEDNVEEEVYEYIYEDLDEIDGNKCGDERQQSEDLGGSSNTEREQSDYSSDNCSCNEKHNFVSLERHRQTKSKGHKKQTTSTRNSSNGSKNKDVNKLKEVVGPVVSQFISSNIKGHQSDSIRSSLSEKSLDISERSVSLSDRTSSLNANLTSSFRNLSFVSIQSPKKDTLSKKQSDRPIRSSISDVASDKLSSKSDNISEQTFVFENSNTHSCRRSRNLSAQTKQIDKATDMSPKTSKLNLKKDQHLSSKAVASTAAVPSSPRRSLRIDSRNTASLKREETKLSKGNVSGRHLLSREKSLAPVSCQDSGISSVEKDTANSQKTFVVEANPNKSELQMANGKGSNVFKSPQGIKVRRVCPIALNDRKPNSSSSAKQTSPSGKRNSDQIVHKSPLKSPKLLQNPNMTNDNQISRGLIDSETTNSSIFDNACWSSSGLSSVSGSTHSVEKSSRMTLASHHPDTSLVQGHSNSGICSPTLSIPTGKEPSFEEPNKTQLNNTADVSESLLIDVSFSSSDEESLDEAEKSWNFILHSPTEVPEFHVFSDPSALGDRYVSSKTPSCPQPLQTIEKGMAAQSTADISLTTSLENMELSTQDMQNSFSVKQHIGASLPFASNKQYYNAAAKNLPNVYSSMHCESCGIHSKYQEPVNTNFSATSQHLRSISTPKSLSVFGFDQSKWRSAVNQPSQMETTTQISSPSHGQLKRKTLGSLTSGYFTDSSSSPQNAHHGFGSSEEQSSFGNTTFTVAACKAKPVIQQNRKQTVSNTRAKSQSCHCSNQCICLTQDMSAGIQNSFCDPNCCQKCHKCQNNYASCLTRSSCGCMKRPHAIAKRRLKSVAESKASSSVENNIAQAVQLHDSDLFSRNQHHRPNYLQLFGQRNTRVCEWVQAASKVIETEPVLRYPSCPLKIPSEYLQDLPIHLSHQEHRKSVIQPSAFGFVHTKRDIGIQASMNSTNVVKDSLLHTAKERMLSAINKYPSQRSSYGIQSFSRTDKGQQSTISTSSCSVQVPGSSPFQNSDSSEPPPNRLSQLPDTLGNRALRAWQDIQKEQSCLETPEDFSITSDYEDLSPTILPCREPQTRLNSPAETIVDSHSSMGDIANKVSPKISSFLRADLNKAIQGNVRTKSFVETHSPMPKVKLPVNSVAARSSFEQAHNSVMFPQSYIDKFSPHNPQRLDSDATTYAYEQKVSSSIPPVSEYLRAFRPRRNQTRKSLSNLGLCTKKHTSSYDKNIGGHAQNLGQSVLDLPLKRRRLSSGSQYSVRESCALTTAATAVQQKFSGACAPIRSSFSTGVPSDKSVKSDKDRGLSQNSEQRWRASTPARQVPSTPDLSIDETISTIIGPLSSDEEGRFIESEDSQNGTVIHTIDSSEADSDSSDYVDLL